MISLSTLRPQLPAAGPVSAGRAKICTVSLLARTRASRRGVSSLTGAQPAMILTYVERRGVNTPLRISPRPEGPRGCGEIVPTENPHRRRLSGIIRLLPQRLRMRTPRGTVAARSTALRSPRSSYGTSQAPLFFTPSAVALATLCEASTSSARGAGPRRTGTPQSSSKTSSTIRRKSHFSRSTAPSSGYSSASRAVLGNPGPPVHFGRRSLPEHQQHRRGASARFPSEHQQQPRRASARRISEHQPSRRLLVPARQQRRRRALQGAALTKMR